MLKAILILSLFNALAWSGVVALFDPKWIPFVFVMVYLATFWVLCFFAGAWRGELDG